MPNVFYAIEIRGNYLHLRNNIEHWSSRIDAATVVRFTDKRAADALAAGRNATSMCGVKVTPVRLARV